MTDPTPEQLAEKTVYFVSFFFHADSLDSRHGNIVIGYPDTINCPDDIAILEELILGKSREKYPADKFPKASVTINSFQRL